MRVIHPIVKESIRVYPTIINDVVGSLEKVGLLVNGGVSEFKGTMGRAAH